MSRWIKIYTSLLLLLTVSIGSNAQNKAGFDWDRVVYGGSAFPFFTNGGFFISANPFVGYKVTDNLVPGVAFSYQYSSIRANGLTEKFSLFGTSPFVRYSFMDRFFIQTEYEFLNGSYRVEPIFPERQRFSENNLFVGGGYISRLGGSTAFFAQAMYNVTWRGAAGNSIYPSPWVIRVGIGIF